MIKTVRELNDKWWYRLVKIVYLALLFLFLVGYPTAVFIYYGPEYDNNNSYIKCANGKEFVLSENGIVIYDSFMGFSDMTKAKDLCFDGVTDFVKGGSSGFMEKVLMPKIISETDNSGKYELISRYTNRNWITTIGLSMLSVVITLFIFEAIRRVFYYVVLGSIRPTKN